VLTLGNRRTESAIELFRSQHGRWVIKLEGIESLSEAETWIGGQVSIEKGDLPEPEEGGYFDFQLKGCTVFENGTIVGRVVEVVDYGGTPQLRVDQDGREVLIPFVRDFLKQIDLERQRIEVDVPEGLLDLNP